MSVTPVDPASGRAPGSRAARARRLVIGGLALVVASGGVALAPIGAATTGAVPSPVTGCTASSPDTLTTGQTLSSAGCLVSPALTAASPSREYELIMQQDGNLVLYYQSSSDPLWDSNTAGNPGASVTMQTDGNLAVTSSSGSVLWNSNTTGTPSATLVMQADGNAVVYGNSAGEQLGTSGSPYSPWSTNTENLRGDQLLFGQALQPGQYLKSPNGQYGLTMGQAGALVLYSTGLGTGGYQCPMWSVPSVTGVNPLAYSFTYQANAYLQVTTAGDLALWRPGGPGSGDSMWDAGISGSGNTAVVQNDGNFVVYSPGGTPLWATDTGVNSLNNQGWALCTGSILQPGESLYAVPASSDYRLTMQSDCNLVLYHGSNTAVWNSNTDIYESNNFKRSSNHSTLYDDDPNQNYAGCYAQQLANGNLEIIAPYTSGQGYGSVANGIWASNTNNIGPTIQMPLGSFGPYLAYPSSGGQLKIDNGAGFTVGTNPNPGDSKSSAVGLDIGKEIRGFVLMTIFAFL